MEDMDTTEAVAEATHVIGVVAVLGAAAVVVDMAEHQGLDVDHSVEEEEAAVEVEVVVDTVDAKKWFLRTFF
jgi:hypothetical protein